MTRLVDYAVRDAAQSPLRMSPQVLWHPGKLCPPKTPEMEIFQTQAVREQVKPSRVRGEVVVREFLIPTLTETLPVLSPGTMSVVLGESWDTVPKKSIIGLRSGPTPHLCFPAFGGGVRYSGFPSCYFYASSILLYLFPSHPTAGSHNNKPVLTTTTNKPVPFTGQQNTNPFTCHGLLGVRDIALTLSYNMTPRLRRHCMTRKHTFFIVKCSCSLTIL